MANCENCKSRNVPENVPYLVHESAMARAERTAKRNCIALIVAILMLFASNLAWLYAWCQYDYTSEETITIDGKDGVANYIGNDGDIVNGDNYGEKEANP